MLFVVSFVLQEMLYLECKLLGHNNDGVGYNELLNAKKQRIN